MNREHEPSVEPLEHIPCLLGRGMHVIPRVVGADAEDGEVNRVKPFVGLCLGGVTSEKDTLG